MATADLLSGAGRRGPVASPFLQRASLGASVGASSLNNNYAEEADKSSHCGTKNGDLRPTRGVPQGRDVSATAPLTVKLIATVGPTTTVETNVEAADGEDPPADLTWAWDDVSGAQLDPTEVKKVTAVEMEHVVKKEVWVPISRATARANGWKVVPTRWIDISKGDKQNPVHRSRFVAKEFNTGAQEGLFAATHPL